MPPNQTPKSVLLKPQLKSSIKYNTIQYQKKKKKSTTDLSSSNIPVVNPRKKKWKEEIKQTIKNRNLEKENTYGMCWEKKQSHKPNLWFV